VPPRTYLYVGCYTDETAVGIRVYDASDPDGLLRESSEVEGLEHPSFLAPHPNGSVLYAVSETTSRDADGLAAFRIDARDGALSMIDRAPSHGAAACHVSLDAAGRYLYVANYLSGTIAVYSLETDGSFGELVAAHQHHGHGPTTRQEGPHAHFIGAGPHGDSVYAVDLGTDRVIRYVHHRDQTEGAFAREDELALHPGSGPRHLAFHSEHAVAFLVCELDSTLVTLGVDEVNGRLTRLHSHPTLPATFDQDSSGAAVRVHPDGRRIYVSNRGHDSLAVFDFTAHEQTIASLGHVHVGGETPRDFAIHPSGRSLLVANQDSNTLVPFAIDGRTGVPEQLDVSYAASQPVCLTFLEVAR